MFVIVTCFALPCYLLSVVDFFDYLISDLVKNIYYFFTSFDALFALGISFFITMVHQAFYDEWPFLIILPMYFLIVTPFFIFFQPSISVSGDIVKTIFILGHTKVKLYYELDHIKSFFTIITTIKVLFSCFILSPIFLKIYGKKERFIENKGHEELTALNDKFNQIKHESEQSDKLKDKKLHQLRQSLLAKEQQTKELVARHETRNKTLQAKLDKFQQTILNQQVELDSLRIKKQGANLQDSNDKVDTDYQW